MRGLFAFASVVAVVAAFVVATSGLARADAATDADADADEASGGDAAVDGEGGVDTAIPYPDASLDGPADARDGDVLHIPPDTRDSCTPLNPYDYYPCGGDEDASQDYDAAINCGSGDQGASFGPDCGGGHDSSGCGCRCDVGSASGGDVFA